MEQRQERARRTLENHLYREIVAEREAKERGGTRAQEHSPQAERAPSRDHGGGFERGR